MLKKGDKAPDFILESDGGERIGLKNFAGRTLILYFYPKDNTSGCSLEGMEFSALTEDFRALGAEIAGASPDSVKSHVKFKEDKGLNIILLSDPENKTSSAYGAYGEKSMYGRKYMGVIRSTFIISPSGTIEETFYKAKPGGHAQAVLQRLRELRS